MDALLETQIESVNLEQIEAAECAANEVLSQQIPDDLKAGQIIPRFKMMAFG